MFKDVMVYLDGGDEDEVRLAHAESIAASFGAHLTGIYANRLPEYSAAFAGEPGFSAIEAVVELEEQARRDGELVLARLKERFARVDVPNEIRRLAAQASEIPGSGATEARWADLFVASAPYRGGGSSLADDVFEAVLFGAGHAVYAVPPGDKVREEIVSIAIAWEDRRESARAIAEALPFLARAANARILLVDGKGGGEGAVDIAAHLDRHGVKVEILALEAGDRTVAQALIDEARKMSADLIVMGAYGHSRFREWVLGGATREMLETSEVPILMAH